MMSLRMPVVGTQKFDLADVDASEGGLEPRAESSSRIQFLSEVRAESNAELHTSQGVKTIGGSRSVVGTLAHGKTKEPRERVAGALHPRPWKRHRQPVEGGASAGTREGHKCRRPLSRPCG
jgi:hypothetical protein